MRRKKKKKKKIVIPGSTTFSIKIKETRKLKFEFISTWDNHVMSSFEHIVLSDKKTSFFCKR